MKIVFVIIAEIRGFMSSEDSMKLKDTVTKDAFRYRYLLNRIYPYIKPVMFRAVLGIIVAIPLGLLEAIPALSLKPYMDYVINGDPKATFEMILHFNFMGHIIGWQNRTFHTQHFWATIIPPGIICFAVIQGGLKYINNYLTDWTGWKISNCLKTDLFRKLTSLDPKFYDVNSSGLVLSRFLGDPDAVSRSIIENVKIFITAIFGILGMVAILMYNAWKLAFIGVAVLGLAMLPAGFIRKKIKQVSNDGMVVGGGMNTNFNETFSGNKIITAYNLQEDRNNLFDSQINEQFGLSMSLTKRSGWLSPIMYLIASCGIAIVLAYGNHLVISKELTSGSLASFVTSLLLLYKPVKNLGNTLTSLQSIFVAMGRTFELFDLIPEIKSEPNSVQMKGFEKQIEFKNVSFEYVQDVHVLKNISLTVPKNETIALVGNSGGGKSTVVNLIPRFYDVKSGSIEIDGIDLRKFDLESLRDNISFVFQDNFLFSGTIRDNIMMGNKNASEYDLQKVVEMAHLAEFIDTLDNGLDTELGERGTTLSGGQRQRVAIARAMLKDAPIVILDEATSALDNQSEAVVQKALDNLMQNKTVFVIAHRLSTIQNADRIAVINEGELAELGTHDELMKIKDGKYKHLYEMQFSKTEAVV